MVSLGGGTILSGDSFIKNGQRIVMERGFFKVFRKIDTHWLWKDKPFSKGQAWLELIKDAHHSEKPYEFLIDFTTIKVTLQKGELFTSVDKLGQKWGWSAKKVRSFLQLLEQEEMIVKKGTTKGTTITIARYTDYADWGKQEIEQGASGGQAVGDKQECIRMNKNEKKKISPKKTWDDYTPEIKKISWKLRKGIIEFEKLTGKGRKYTEEENSIKCLEYAIDIDRMIRIDVIDKQNIVDVIQWLNDFELDGAMFWRPNILSADKLRKQYPKLYAKYIEDLNQ